MPAYNNPEEDPTLEQLTAAVYKVVLEIKEVTLDLQQRQKKMDARQLAIKEEIEESPVAQPVGSFATGYQHPKKE